MRSRMKCFGGPGSSTIIYVHTSFSTLTAIREIFFFIIWASVFFAIGCCPDSQVAFVPKVKKKISFCLELSEPSLSVLIWGSDQTPGDRGCSFGKHRFLSEPDTSLGSFLVILKVFVTCVGVTLTQIYSDKADVMKEWRRESLSAPLRPILTNGRFTRAGSKR